VFHKTLNKGFDEAPELTKGTSLDIDCGRKPYERIFQNKVNYYVGIDLLLPMEFLKLMSFLNNPKGRVPRACPWVKRSLNCFDLNATALAVGIYINS